MLGLEGITRRLNRAYSVGKSNWLEQHPNAELKSKEPVGDGFEVHYTDPRAGQSVVVITDSLGNVMGEREAQ